MHINDSIYNLTLKYVKYDYLLLEMYKMYAYLFLKNQKLEKCILQKGKVLQETTGSSNLMGKESFGGLKLSKRLPYPPISKISNLKTDLFHRFMQSVNAKFK